MATWDLSNTKHHILLCNGSTCTKHGAEDVITAIRESITKNGLDDKIHTTRTKCNGRCKDRCVVVLYPEGKWLKNVTPEMADNIVIDHITEGKELGNVVYDYNETFNLVEGNIVGEKK